jgi:microcin C transport system substrate-binding protein
MNRLHAIMGAAVAVVLMSAPADAIVRGKPVHGIAIHGEVKYGPNQPFGYVNPKAPKGGQLTLSNANDATFDTFNPFILKGTPARGVGLLFESLLTSGMDEPSGSYCLVCETVEVAADNSWVEFKLRKEARFTDGSPITADDVVFSYTTLVEKGAPMYRVYWSEVDKPVAIDARTVRFPFKNKNNNELASIIGQIPILSKAYWAKHKFEDTTLEPPVGSGPYLVESFDIGKHITWKRNDKYWAKDLPIMQGFYNFDRVRWEYFRDDTVRFEAFKTGGFDINYEFRAQRWSTGYDFPAFKDGRVKKLDVVAQTPIDAQNLTINLRRAKYQDRRVREALNLAFDFESLNKTLFYGLYTRVRSYWQRSELEAKGLPSKEELALLEPLRQQVPPEVFTQEFKQPVTSGTGAPRENLLKARDLLAQAGWVLKDGVLVNAKSGEPFTIEVMTVQEGLERVILPWFQNLERLGIKGTIRQIDTAQFINRITEFDFDATAGILIQNSLSPGNEQLEYWSAASADRKGSRNVAGVKDPAVDALIQAIMNAKDRPSLVTATHALDRVLQWNYFTLLEYSSESMHYAYWTKLQHPERFPLHGMATPDAALENWWMDPKAVGAKP